MGDASEQAIKAATVYEGLVSNVARGEEKKREEGKYEGRRKLPVNARGLFNKTTNFFWQTVIDC